jgi:uncharacterized YigZ family protein
MKDEYLSIKKISTGEFRDRASKFIAYAKPINNEEEAKSYISALWKEHPKARHVCFAYVLGPETKIFRYNDDGEPSGTAGKPIFNSIKSYKLEHVLVAVVRYFGGTKLGTSGLINAYKKSSLKALETATIMKKYLTDLYAIHFDYRIMGNLLGYLKKKKIKIITKKLDENPSVTIELRRSVSGHTLIQIKANLLGKTEEEIDKLTEVPGCTFNKLSNA